MQDSSPLLIATLPPSRAQQRAALTVAVALFAFFLAVLPVAHVRLPRIDAVIPVVSTIMALGDCISAVLLFGQFAVLRSRALLVLAGGYLFTGLLVIPYALTFPGALSETGLLGAGLQTAAWIFVFWHLGLPIAVIAYALLGEATGQAQLVRAPVPSAIAASAATALALAVAIAWAAIAFNDALPAVTMDTVRMTRDVGVLASVVCLSLAGVVVLARRRRWSVLDLWLLVVTFAWLLDAAFTFMTESRFTGAWYANRVVRIVSANIVLFVLLAESTRLYAKLASSVMAQQREREARRMSMEAMSAAIEHEVRQPLAAIVANANAVQQLAQRSPPDTAEIGDAARDILGEAARATATLHSVRELFASPHREHKPLDLNALVEETVGLARNDLDAAAVGVQLQLGERLPPVDANRQQLQELLLNLVDNAAEAMAEVTHAAVLRITTAAAGDDRIEITVADTGTGIAPENIDRIFDAFFTTKPGGTGMGLAICRSIVERHGGTLTAARGEPYGAIFRIVLPSG